MTERIGNVDPPFDRRCVQLTLAVIASVAIAWLLITSWNAAPQPQHTPHLDANGTALIQIDLNRAEVRELALLPGVGPILANRIAENRDRLGRFPSVDDLGRVDGIGPKTLDQIRRIGFVDSNQGSFDPESR